MTSAVGLWRSKHDLSILHANFKLAFRRTYLSPLKWSSFSLPAWNYLALMSVPKAILSYVKASTSKILDRFCHGPMHSLLYFFYEPLLLIYTIIRTGLWRSKHDLSNLHANFKLAFRRTYLSPLKWSSFSLPAWNYLALMSVPKAILSYVKASTSKILDRFCHGPMHSLLYFFYEPLLLIYTIIRTTCFIYLRPHFLIILSSIVPCT